MSQLNEVAQYVNRMLQNYQHASSRLPVSGQNIVQEMHDGALLCCLANVMSKQGSVIEPSSIKFQKATIFHKMDNVNRALDAMKKLDLSIINIRAEFIVEKKEKSLIGLFNQLTKQRPAPKKKVQIKVEESKEEKPIEAQEQKFEEVVEVQHYQKKQYNFILPRQEEKIPQENQQVMEIQVHKIPENHEIIINRDPVFLPAAHDGYVFQPSLGTNILVFCGSLRKGSYNKGLINALEEIKKKQFFINVHFHFADLSILPLFNEDLVRQSRIPKAVYDLMQKVTKVSGILISTPQYNYCLSPLIKNVLDWLTLAQEGSILAKKKVAVIGASYFSDASVEDVRTICKNNGANVFNQVFYINLKSKAFDASSGKLASSEQIDRISLWYQDFSNFIISGKDHPEPIPRFIY